MRLEPKIELKRNAIGLKTCSKCQVNKPKEYFIEVSSWFYDDQYAPICNSCIKEYMREVEWEWQEVDQLCQYLDIPFIPSQFEKMHDEYGDEVFPIYARLFKTSEYERFGWKDYHQKYLELKTKHLIDKELPRISDTYYDDLRLRWGMNYDNEELTYLENLFNGLLASQNVVGALGMDQAQKMCKISLNIDERIRSGTDFDKLMASYEKMAKIADFTPKNAKSDSDFSSMGEVVAWLEKREWINTFYDDVNRDIVDEVIHSQEAFVQRLYTNESNMGEEITERIEQLKLAAALEKGDQDLEQKRFNDDPFFEVEEVNLEKHDNEMYEELLVDDVLDSDTTRV